jgi:hypothetical protein
VQGASLFAIIIIMVGKMRDRVLGSKRNMDKIRKEKELLNSWCNH